MWILLLGYPSLAQAESKKPVLQAPLFDNLGLYTHPVATKVPLAKRFFDQGLILFYGFEWGESIRSFKEATRLDPTCGMCYWGLALALGNKLNAPMNGHEYSDGKAAIQQALSLVVFETPVERDYIKALSLRFQHTPKIIKQAGAFSCHTSSNQQDESSRKEKRAYAKAMKIQHAMSYHEPPDWYFPVRQALGDAYLKWGHPQQAKAMYEQDLRQYPNNGWSLYGLAKSLRVLKANERAARIEEEFKQAWKYADIPAPVSLFPKN